MKIPIIITRLLLQMKIGETKEGYVAKRNLKIVEEKTEEDTTEEIHSMSE